MKTVLHPKSDSEKSINLAQEVFDAIRHIRDSYNGRVTMGVVVYELLMMNGEYVGEYQDAVDGLETRIDEELEETLQENNKRLDGNITEVSRRVDSELWMRGRLRDDNDWGDTVGGLKISLPEQLTDELTFERGWSERLRDCLTDWIESPFASRLYRIESKQALRRYVETDDIPNDDVAKAIISQDTSELRNLPTIDDITIESEMEYRARAGELDGWREERYPALDNFADELSRKEAVELMKQVHDVDTDWYAEDKVEEFADEYNHQHLLNEEEDDNKETVLDRMTDKERADLSPATVQNWADEADTETGRLELVSQALINELNRGNKMKEVDAELCFEDVNLDADDYGVSDLPKLMLIGDEIEQK
jgi:hypothetical protein